MSCLVYGFSLRLLEQVRGWLITY